MTIKHRHSLLLLALMIPFLLAAKNWDRSTTWGQEKIYGEWEGDHPDVDAETRCVDCHDGIASQKVKPSSHYKITWKRQHGSYSQKKFGFNKGNVCNQCHSEMECVKCHQQEEPANHTEFWKIRGHGAFVALDRSRCISCHKGVDFCERCHSGTRPRSHNALWAGSANQHCQNCHLPVSSTEAQQCYVCHKSTPTHPW